MRESPAGDVDYETHGDAYANRRRADPALRRSSRLDPAQRPIYRGSGRSSRSGALSTVVGQKLERPLSSEDDAKLAESYRKRFLLRLAFSEGAALLGFVGFFLTYACWPYPIGAAITGMGCRRAAPTSTRLARIRKSSPPKVVSGR